MRFLLVLGLLYGGCGNRTGSDSPAGEQRNTNLPEGFWEHWGDGKAELNGYKLVQPRYGEKRRGEAVLVEVASEREFSPSDARLQDKLNVRRPRMSQMCNRLYRGGILSVQQKGRTRMFKLTNDARAQLVAWGMMEASV